MCFVLTCMWHSRSHLVLTFWWVPWMPITWRWSWVRYFSSLIASLARVLGPDRLRALAHSVKQTGQEPAPMFEGIATPPSGLPTAAPGIGTTPPAPSWTNSTNFRRRSKWGYSAPGGVVMRFGRGVKTPYRPEPKKDNQGLENSATAPSPLCSRITLPPKYISKRFRVGTLWCLPVCLSFNGVWWPLFGIDKTAGDVYELTEEFLYG